MAYSLAAYLDTADMVDSSAAPTARASTRVEEVVRSYVGTPMWPVGGRIQVRTTQPDTAGLLVNGDRPEDRIVTLIVEFLDLGAGWDGENAQEPALDAVLDAIRFVHAAGDLATRLEPTLHVDGSVILELDDGSAGSLRFKGDDAVIYTLDGAGVGVALFDGYTIPEKIAAALIA